MPLSNAKNALLFIVLSFILSGCSKSDDQRRFEDEAFVEPEGITETTADGSIISGEEDPGDWNISPMYQSLIVVEEPASPNPVKYNSRFTIQINFRVEDAVSEMVIWSFRYPDVPNGPVDILDQSRVQWFNTITIPASSVATGGEGTGASGLYRILIYDGRKNLITYGDVEVE